MSRFKHLLFVSSFWLNAVSNVFGSAQATALQIVQESKVLHQKDVLQFVEEISEHNKPTVFKPDLPESSKPACRGHVPQSERAQDEILIFVSFSMPDAALKGLFQEAQNQNSRLILRGLVDDSFKKTQQKVQRLNINVDIDPNLFEEHNVTHVPTFVKAHHKQALILKGHVSLAYVQEQFAKATKDTSCS